MAFFHVYASYISKGATRGGATGLARYLAREHPEMATQHMRYLARDGREKDDLVACGYGALPVWATDDHDFWLCADRFERQRGCVARVYHGPDTGVELAGELTLTIDPSGSHRGVLTQPDGSGVSVVGQVTGQSLTVLFDVGEGRFISGLGTADSDIRACNFTTLVGPFVGPDFADSGTWEVAQSNAARVHQRID